MCNVGIVSFSTLLSIPETEFVSKPKAFVQVKIIKYNNVALKFEGRDQPFKSHCIFKLCINFDLCRLVCFNATWVKRAHTVIGLTCK